MKKIIAIITLMAQLAVGADGNITDTNTTDTNVTRANVGIDVECQLSHESMILIAKTEKHPQRRLGYPYLISFNNTKDAERMYQKYQSLFIPNKGVDRSIDCQNEQMCVDILHDLLSQNITNVDLGAYQINYGCHKLPHENYFRVAESYEYACAYAYSFVRQYGETFRSLAMYHSQTPKYRNIYAKRMYDEYKKSN